jgi:hypothetical protein
MYFIFVPPSPSRTAPAQIDTRAQIFLGGNFQTHVEALPRVVAESFSSFLACGIMQRRGFYQAGAQAIGVASLVSIIL